MEKKLTAEKYSYDWDDSGWFYIFKNIDGKSKVLISHEGYPGDEVEQTIKTIVKALNANDSFLNKEKLTAENSLINTCSNENVMLDGFLKDFCIKAMVSYASQECSSKDERIKELEEENNKLKKFKEYVHERLDKMSVPSDPEPENNAKHGCRIEGRLNFIENNFV